MKITFIVCILFLPFFQLAQVNECVTIIDKTMDNSVLFDDENPLSFVRVVDQSRFRLKPMSRRTFEEIRKISSTSGFSFNLGPQSDVPLETTDGEDSMIIMNGYMCFCYPPADTFYYDLSNISRLVIKEGPIIDSSSHKIRYGIKTVGFAKRFPGSDLYFITVELDYNAFLGYKGYHIDIEAKWDEIFTGNSSGEEAFEIMKEVALANQKVKPGEKQDDRVKALECSGIHEYMWEPDSNLTYRANSSNLKYNASYVCPVYYTLKKELRPDQLIYSVQVSPILLPMARCGDTMINNRQYYNYPVYHWLKTDEFKTVFAYKAKNLSDEKLEMESISFIGQIDNQPSLLMRLILDKPNSTQKNELDSFIERLNGSQTNLFDRSVNYAEILEKALLMYAKTYNSTNANEWDRLKKEVFWE